jgi:hypothetical protein
MMGGGSGLPPHTHLEHQQDKFKQQSWTKDSIRQTRAEISSENKFIQGTNTIHIFNKFWHPLMLFTRAATFAPLKMDQEIVETTTVLLTGSILSDWFESQMPCWFLNHCKGRKCYCLTTCLAMQQLI